MFVEEKENYKENTQRSGLDLSAADVYSLGSGQTRLLFIIKVFNVIF